MHAMHWHRFEFFENLRTVVPIVRPAHGCAELKRCSLLDRADEGRGTSEMLPIQKHQRNNESMIHFYRRKE